MLDFIYRNIVVIIVSAFLIWYISHLVLNKKWEQLRATAYKMIIYAEKAITGSKKGKERFELVLEKLYSLVPTWLRFFFDEITLRLKLQEWYDHIKDYLDNGVIDGSSKSDNKG